MALFNVLTSNNYYTNIILFNFLFLFGLVALFKVFAEIFPGKKLLIILSVFLLPSTLFWCSGIHKDGLILSALGVSIYCFNQVINNRFSFKYVALIAVSFVLMFALRNYILFALLPAFLCWAVSSRYPNKKSLVFAGFYLLGIVCFFMIPHVFPSIDLPRFLASRQQEFLQLSGTSAVTTAPLQPTLTGFISFLPQALDMAFLRPHPNEFHNFSYLPAIVENLLLIALIIFSIASTRKKTFSPTVISLLAFSISVLLICGYTIPFTGAVVRYKSLVLPLLITPLLCMTRFSR